MGGCVFIEYLNGWVWVGVTVQITFMGWCTFLEYIYGCTFLEDIMDGCGCLEDIYGWV